MTLKRTLLSGILLLLVNCAVAQPTVNRVGIDKYPFSSLSSYLSELKKAKEDTSKADLLLKIASIYYGDQSKGLADSALSFARSAAALSKSLKYLKVYNNATYLVCASLLLKRDFEAAKEVLKNVYGEMYICILLNLSGYYVDARDVTPDELRKAYPYLGMADSLSAKQQSRHWMTESIIAKAKYHFRLGEMTLGKNCFYRVIQYYQQIGDKGTEAHWWDELGRYIPDSDSTYAVQIFSFNKARVLFHELGDRKQEAYCIGAAGYVHSCHNRPDLTEKLYLSELQTLKSGGVERKLPASYQRLSEFYQKQHDFDKALQFALMGLKSLNSLHDNGQSDALHTTLGNIYGSMGDYASSIMQYKLVLASSPVHRVWTYKLIRLLVIAYLEAGKPREGLMVLRSFISKKATPETAVNKQLIAFLFGKCYNAIGNFKTAERYYLEMIRLSKDVELSQQLSWGKQELIEVAETYLTIGKFYTERGKYNLADFYLKKVLDLKNLTPAFEIDSRLLIFKVDSAAGNYLASIGNYQRYIFLKDSITESTKDKEFSILKADFKAAQKDKDFKILQKEATLQKQKLELSARTEKFTYGGLAALFCLLGLSYNRYRLKQKKNLQLEEQQKTINMKNHTLLHLVSEKEWLLREVHHRVKNNLQIVISLLNSQSAYLKEDVAVNAILESRHRIQAMSMLHQRIYQSQNMSGIAMPSYIHELVYYLNNSFNLGKRIIFNVSVEDIMLDLVQAVPVGLILNEAITNSLKYAFPNQRDGEIKVSLKKIHEGPLLLSIADDGIGLCQDFNIEEIKSFGLKLINGLTEDLEGDFSIKGQPGTTLLIEFDQKLVMGSYQQDLHGIGV
jgi:two-component sensor histidine kinase